MGKSVFAEQLDEGDVAAWIEADEHGVDEAAVGQAALHGGAGGAGDVEVRQGVAVGRDDDAGAAALAVGVEDGDRRAGDAGDRFDAGGFGGENGGSGSSRLESGECAMQLCERVSISDCGLRIANAIRNPQSAIRNPQLSCRRLTSRSSRRRG